MTSATRDVAPFTAAGRAALRVKRAQGDLARDLRRARDAGFSLRELAKVSGMTPEGVRQLLKRTASE